MRRRLNVRFLAILVVATALLGGGAALLHRFQVGRTAPRLLERAAKAEEGGRLDRAASFLGRYLAIKPEDAEALARLGALTEETAGGDDGRRAQALLRYEQALRFDPTRAETRRRLIRLALELQPPHVTEARTHLEALAAETSNDGELELYLGRCAEAERRGDAGTDPKRRVSWEDRAIAWYEKACAHRPDLIAAYARAAALMRARPGGAGRAEKVLDAMVAANPRSAEARLTRGLYRRDAGRPGGDEDIARALELAPDDPTAVAANVDRALGRRDWDGARRLLERLVKLVPRSRPAHRRLAALEVRADHLDRAAERLVAGLEALPGDDDLRSDLAEVHIRRGKYDEAASLIAALQQSGRKPELADYLAARLLVARGRWAEATRALEAVRPRLTATPELAKGADLMMAVCYERQGDLDGRFEANRRLAAEAPDATLPRMALGGTLETMGRYDEALEQYRQLPADEPGVKLSIARAVVLRTLGQPPDRRRWDEAERALAAAAAADPKSPLLAVLRADMLAARGRVDEAVTLLTTARDAAPDEPATWLALAAALERQGKPEAVATLLEAAEKRLGDRVELRLLRARRLAAAGGPDAAEGLTALGRGLEKFPAEDQRRLALGLANARGWAGDNAAALATWQAWARRQVEDHRLLLVTFDLAIKAGDARVMDETLAALQRIEGVDGVAWRYGRARRILVEAARGDAKAPLNEARALLETVAEKRPNWANVRLILAQIDELQGQPDRAIQDFLKAIDLGASDPEVLRHVVQLMGLRGRYADAERVLARLQDRSMATGEIQKMAAEVSWGNRDAARALELARTAVSADSKDYRDHVWLGLMLARLGRAAEAEAPLRRAVELAGDQPDARVNLVRVLALAGRRDQAEAAAREAAAALPKQPLAAAECYRLAGRGDDAERSYRRALAAKPDDPAMLREVVAFYLQSGRFRDAQPHLEHLAGLGAKAGDDARWGRNLLAMVLAAGGDPERSRAALALLGLSGGTPAAASPTPAAAVDDRRTQARVLALQRDERRRREAVALLEGLTRGPDAAPADQLLLAQLYEGLGDWPKAKPRFQAAAEADRSPRTITLLVQALVRHKQGDEAGRWLDRLEATAPATVRLKALVLREQGKVDRAVATVEDFGRDGSRLESAATILEQLGQLGPAERAFRRLAKASPQGGLALARFLGRRGRVAEALDLCDATWATCAPQDVATAGVEIVNGPTADEAQRARVATRIEAATGRDPDRRELVVSLAILRGLQGRYPEAEALYRKALAADPRDVVALNNLAWLLTLRETRGTEALELIERAIAVAGAQPALLDTRAVVLLATGRFDPAIRDLEQAIAAEPEAAKYFHLARAHWLAKSPAAAAEALKNGEELGLKPAALDPLERPEYSRLVVAIGGRK
ncbi:MAG TPA: tetratricopeptide repeat protein [Isosphaeraceae bacterium]|nr:tetratricopeptide repeat protein [Isosphaeraceae bacterium]